MTSEMWQRIRAARTGAGLRQIDLAKKLGITRSGFAFLETTHAASRVTPNVEQIKAIAQATKVPLDMMMSDTVSETEVLRAAMAATEGRPPPSLAANTEHMRDLALSAVQYHVLSRDPSRAGSFCVQVARHLSADCVWGKHVVVVADRDPYADIGRLLLLDQAAKFPVVKHLIFLGNPDPVYDALSKVAGVVLHYASSAEQCADLILSLH